MKTSNGLQLRKVLKKRKRGKEYRVLKLYTGTCSTTVINISVVRQPYSRKERKSWSMVGKGSLVWWDRDKTFLTWSWQHIHITLVHNSLSGDRSQKSTNWTISSKACDKNSYLHYNQWENSFYKATLLRHGYTTFVKSYNGTLNYDLSGHRQRLYFLRTFYYSQLMFSLRETAIRCFIQRKAVTS